MVLLWGYFIGLFYGFVLLVCIVISYCDFVLWFHIVILHCDFVSSFRIVIFPYVAATRFALL